MIYSLIFKFITAPIAIKIFMDLIAEQKYTSKQFYNKAVISLVLSFVESAVIILTIPNLKEVKIINPLFAIMLKFEFSLGVIFAVIFHIYCQIPTFLLFFSILSHNKKYIKKVTMLHFIWIFIIIFFSIAIGDTR